MSKSAKGLITIIILLILACLLIYPLLSDGASNEEESDNYTVIFMNGNAEYSRINVDAADPVVGNNMPKTPSGEENKYS